MARKARARKNGGSAKKKEDSDSLVRATSKYAVPLWLMLPPKREGVPHKYGTCYGEAGPACAACRTLRALETATREVTKALNTAIRLHARIDGDLLDAFVAEHGRMPKKGDGIAWPKLMSKEGVYTYDAIRKACPGLSSHIAAALQKQAAAYWGHYRFDTLILQTRSVPTFKESPIPIPAQSSRLTHVEGKKFSLSFSLEAGKEGQRFEVIIEARDARQEKELVALTTGLWKKGALQLFQDKNRFAKWFFRISYKRLKPPTPEGERVMGINRGIVAFLAWAAFDGTSDFHGGLDIVSTLRGFQRRRRVYQAQARWSNRGGHGRKRILRPIERLEGKGERWRQNTCQTIARQFTRVCVQKGITIVGIEDFQGIRNKTPEQLEGGKYVYQLLQEWPYYQLQMRIVSCLEEAGIKHVIIPAKHISQECPECRFTSPANIDWKSHYFHCRQCNYHRHLDVVAAINVRDRVREHLAGFTPPGPVREPPAPLETQPFELDDDDEVLLPEPLPPAPAVARKASRKRV